MTNPRKRQAATAATILGLSLASFAGVASAQDTSTTQLDIGGGTATTSAAPTRVEAGGGGTADSGVPFTTIALAGAGVVVVGASAERMRRAAVAKA